MTNETSSTETNRTINYPFIENPDCPLGLPETVGTFVFSNENTDKIIIGIGQRIKKYRMKYGYSIDRLASTAGISPGAIYKIEKGQTKVGLKNLLKICYTMQVPLDNMIPSVITHNTPETLGDTIDNVWGSLKETEKQVIINFIKVFIAKTK